MDWADRVDQLCYDGETEQRRVDVGDGTIVVTSHRVLAFTPSGDGRYSATDDPRYRAVDRPNVDGVSVASTGSVQYLLWTAVLACLAIATAVTAIAVSFTELVATPDLESDAGEGTDPGSVGPDVATESVAAIESLLAVLDLAVVVVSALSIGLAAVCFVGYLRSRSRQLVVSVRGDNDLEIPVGTETLGTTPIELQNAIRPGPTLENETTVESALEGEQTAPAHDAGGFASEETPADGDFAVESPASETGNSDLETVVGRDSPTGRFETTGDGKAATDLETRSTGVSETRSTDEIPRDDGNARGESPIWADDAFESDHEQPVDTSRDPFDLERSDELEEDADGGFDLESADDFVPGRSGERSSASRPDRGETGGFEFDRPSLEDDTEDGDTDAAWLDDDDGWGEPDSESDGSAIDEADADFDARDLTDDLDPESESNLESQDSNDDANHAGDDRD